MSASLAQRFIARSSSCAIVNVFCVDVDDNPIFCSAFAVIGLVLGLNPYYAFVLSLLTFIPIRILVGGKIFSQTGTFASFGAVAALSYFNMTPIHSFLLGAACGYSYLYFWVLIIPKLLKD